MALACHWPCRSAHRSLPELEQGSGGCHRSNMEQLKIEEGAAEGWRINHWTHTALLASVHKSIMRWRESEATERRSDCATWRTNGLIGCRGLSSLTHLWPWRGWCGAPSRADSWPCSGNLQRPTPTRSQYEGPSGSAGKIFAWLGDLRSLWSRRFQGLAWNQREGRDKERWWHSSRWALEQAFRTEEMANYFTYSPSAIHSISSTCPLSTVLELEGPDGVRNDGFLSSAGSSIVTDSERKLLSTLLH